MGKELKTIHYVIVYLISIRLFLCNMKAELILSVQYN